MSRKQQNRVMKDDSDDDLFYASGESASKTEDAESQPSEDEDEINLQEIDSDEEYSQEYLFSSTPGMIWSSVPSHPGKSRFCRGVIENSEPTEFTEHIASLEDAFLCVTLEEMLSKILVYSNMEGNRNNTYDK